MTIFIIEIPHQMPPKCWSAHDRASAISIIERSFDRSGGIDEYMARGGAKLYEEDSEGELVRVAPEATFENFIEMNGHDLSSQMVFEDEAEARAALNDDSNWNRHGGFKAKAALAAELGVEVE